MMVLGLYGHECPNPTVIIQEGVSAKLYASIKPTMTMFGRIILKLPAEILLYRWSSEEMKTSDLDKPHPCEPQRQFRFSL